MWTADLRVLSVLARVLSNFFTATSFSILNKLHSALNISAWNFHFSSSNATDPPPLPPSPLSTLSLLSPPSPRWSNTTTGTTGPTRFSRSNKVPNLFPLRSLRAPAAAVGGLRRGRRGKWRILGVGGGGGWCCHLGLLVAVVDIFSCSEMGFKRIESNQNNSIRI